MTGPPAVAGRVRAPGLRVSGTPAGPGDPATGSATAWGTSSRGWVDIPGAATAFSPAAGSSATFNAVYSGETSCAGDAATWCSFRVVVVATSGMSEFKPAAGTDFVLATAGAPTANQSVQRTADGFPGGAGYTIKAQVTVVGAGTPWTTGTSPSR